MESYLWRLTCVAEKCWHEMYTRGGLMTPEFILLKHDRCTFLSRSCAHSSLTSFMLFRQSACNMHMHTLHISRYAGMNSILEDRR